MTRILRSLVVSVALMLAITVPAATFTEAVTAYQKGDAKSCLAVLEAIHASGKHAPESWLLDGNARALEQDMLGAILSYRRALMLDPNLAEARQNLLVLTRKNGIPEPGEPAPMKRLLDQLPRGSIWLAGAIGLWLAVAGARVWLAGKGPAMASLLPLTLGGTMLVAAAAATIFPAHAATTANNTRWWVADAQLTRDIPLRADPVRRADPVLEKVPAGTTLRIIQDAGWAYVEVPSGNNGRPLRGWIEPGSWCLLWPYDRSFVRNHRP